MAKRIIGTWEIVSSPDFDDEYLNEQGTPYVRLQKDGDRIGGEYHIGLQNGSLDGRPQPDGSILLPNQWSLRPAGRQVELGDFPINMAVHPRGRFAAILHSGYSAHEVVVVVEVRILLRVVGRPVLVVEQRVRDAAVGLVHSYDI